MLQSAVRRMTLERLLEYLDGLNDRPTVEDLRARLDALRIGVEDVADSVQFLEHQYARNLFRRGPHYHALVLCWRSGQRSPIHNHAGSTCGVRVLSGVATETVFERTPSSLLKPAASTDLACGQVVATQDEAIHQVSNVQGPGEDLITLHIYAPPLLRMDTFSLTDRAVGEFRPTIHEHNHGCGI